MRVYTPEKQFWSEITVSGLILAGAVFFSVYPMQEFDLWVKMLIVVLLIFAAVYFFMCALSIGRVFSFSKDGVVVYFFYKVIRRYKWEDFKSKLYILRDVGPHKETVVLYKKKYPHRIEPKKYSFLFSPLSMIYVHLEDDVNKYLNKRYGYKQYNYNDVYLVNKVQFLEKMEEWGIELERVEVLDIAERTRRKYSWYIPIAFIVLIATLILANKMT